MGERPLRILQVSSHDIHGGAAKVAWDLFETYRERGHQSYLAVGEKLSDDPNVFPIPNFQEQQKSLWFDLWHNRMTGPVAALKRRRVPGAWRLPDCFWWLAQPGRWFDRRLGIEDFRFPGTKRLLDLPPQAPDVVHCHNLHGGYFDLRLLPALSRRAAVVLHLHDAWLLSGLCSHSFDCDRWRTGCGKCPLLHLFIDDKLQPPPDATAFNWRRKRKIYRRSRFYVTAPCHWLMDRVQQSILALGAVETRVIPYGVDLALFQPGDKQAARRELAIPANARVLLFVANGIRNNPAKDYETLRAALVLLGKETWDRPVLAIARGEQSPPEQIGAVTLKFVPFKKDFREVALYYQAADICLHSAHVDTFPLVVLEALACGTPVVATGVCGIPEQVRGLEFAGGRASCHPHDKNEATGILVPAKDPRAMAGAVSRLLRNDDLRAHLSANAVQDARNRFDLRQRADENLAWYAEMLTATAPEREQSSPRQAEADVDPLANCGARASWNVAVSGPKARK